MMAGLAESRKQEPYGTPELRGLFEEWLNTMELSVAEFVGKYPGASYEEIAQQFDLSKESAQFLFDKAVREGKIAAAAAAR
ncbi:MAG: hypothetical protein AB1805_02205 [Nitrospirota bacterium]